MRTFIAIPVPATPPLKSVLRRMSTWPALRTTDADKLHLTLTFLGETDEKLLPQLNQIVSNAAATVRQQSATYRSLGAFPGTDRPTVVWVGLADPAPWVGLADVLWQRCEELGFPREARAYHPHVTLARVKSRPPEQLAELIQDQLKAELGSVLFSSLELYRSDLRPDGPVYTSLCSAPLAPIE